MQRKFKKRSATQVACYILVAVIALGAVGGLATIIIKNNPKLPTFTATAEPYKDLQKFSYWADENGKKVSTDNPYTYSAETEAELTAVYDDFIQVEDKVLGSSYNATFTPSALKYAGGNLFNGFGYITEPLKYGMTITLKFSFSGMLVGATTKERIDDCANHVWGTNFSTLFVPEFNVYSNAAEPISKMVESSTATRGGKTTINDMVLKGNKDCSIKIVLADKMLWYVNNVLVNSEDYNKKAAYYVTMAGATYTIAEFGYDKDSTLASVSVPLTESDFAGKKITFLGDSITAGNGSNFSSTTERYASVLSAELNTKENNMGISGTTLCTGHVERSSRLGDIAKIPTDSDYVFVMLGTNDFDLASATFATLGTDGTTDTSTVHGAAEQMCKTLAEMFAKNKYHVFIVTPITRQDDLTSTTITKNGYTLRQFCEVLIAHAQKYGLQYIDMNAECGMTTDDFANSIHPNASGTTKIVNVLKKHLLANWGAYTPFEI